jgi:hypothetical protein
MRDRPFTKLFIAVSIFVIVSLVFAHFRHGFNIIDLAGVLIGTLISAACLDHFIWPDRSGGPVLRRFVSFLDFSIAGFLTVLFLLGTYNLPRPKWMVLLFAILCLGKAFYLWFEHRKNKRLKNTTDSLQMRFIETNRDRVV